LDCNSLLFSSSFADLFSKLGELGSNQLRRLQPSFLNSCIDGIAKLLCCILNKVFNLTFGQRSLRANFMPGFFNCLL
jgi:hypothetical protein